MPANSEKQRRFRALVNALQNKEGSARAVSPKVRKVAKDMTKTDRSRFMHKKAAGGISESLGPIPGMLAPFISSTKVKTDQGSVPIASGGLLGVNDLATNYEDYINKRERERLMTPMAKKMHYLQSQLARKIALEMGMSPEQAIISSTKLSPPSIMAWGLMKANGVDSVLAKFDTVMKEMGVISPHGLGAAKTPTSATQRKLQSVMNNMLEVSMSPLTNNNALGMSANDVADLMLDKLKSGDFNPLLTSKNAFLRNGELHPNAKRMLFNDVSNTARAVKEFQYLFPKTSPIEAKNKMIEFFGEDPIKKFGSGKVTEMFRTLRSTSRAAGISPEDSMSLLTNIGSNFKESGRNPLDAVLVAKDMMLLSAASRDGISAGVNPGKFNQSLIASLAASRQAPAANLASNLYAAVSRRVGEKNAENIVSQILADKKVIKNPAKMVEKANSLMLRYPAAGGQGWTGLNAIDPTKLEAYSNDPLAQKFKSTGADSTAILHHYGEQMLNFRKKILTKQFNWSDEQIKILDNMGGPTMENISKFVRMTGPPSDPDAMQKRVFDIEKKLNGLAQNQGFEKAQAADRFLFGIRNTPALSKFKAASRRTDRVAESLNKFPRQGGFKGLTQYLSGDKSQGNWWEALTGSKTLSPQDVAQLQGVDVRALEAKLPGVWDKTVSTWLRPEGKTPQERTQAFKVMDSLPEMR